MTKMRVIIAVVFTGAAGAAAAVWVVDHNNAVISFDLSGHELARVNGIRAFTCAVDEQDGSCWIADWTNNRVLKVTNAGSLIAVIPNINFAFDITVNPNDRAAWVTAYNDGKVFKISNGSVVATVSGLNHPRQVSIYPAADYCWIADTSNARLVKVNNNGSVLATYDVGLYRPMAVSVDPVTGDVWTAGGDGAGNSKVVRLNQNGSIFVSKTFGPYGLLDLSVDRASHRCWVAGNASVSRVGRMGLDLEPDFWNTSFSLPQQISCNPADGSCWVADSGPDKVFKLNASGSIVTTFTGFTWAVGVEVEPILGNIAVTPASLGRIKALYR